MPDTHAPAGRRPRNEATLKHTDLLGGFDYLRADYTEQTFPRHSHEEYLVGVIEDGVHDVWCKGEWWHASKNVVATFSPDEAHHGGLGDTDAWRQTIFYFPREIVSVAMDCADSTYSFHQPFKHSPETAARLLKLRRLLESGSDRLLLEQEVLQSVGQVFETMSNAVDEEKATGENELAEVRTFIHDNIQGAFDISTLADLSGFTKRQFMSRFQKKFHMAPYQYVMQARVRRARDMLQKGSSIADAVFQAGFSDQSHLTRNFRAIYGVTPARYIRQAT
ncbi:AraC family transcriptional regulator [Alisedimentitalea sp. MJ-SS2]|uniref:AraC family transcriptional regulator n=1 Tax=Aliisedimentitalea sp. MJ-SS2 TaxID=3049795 RepID=UPI002912843D|nr:AraC family transcriptional regulator [Alisedimentitalea sp. MJ-SS2]MDU8929250.1 AraC family transcriptional regulator [Alisedimentitalea sp. MJ-SS2]